MEKYWVQGRSTYDGLSRAMSIRPNQEPNIFRSSLTYLSNCIIMISRMCGELDLVRNCDKLMVKFFNCMIACTEYIVDMCKARWLFPAWHYIFS